MNTLTISDSTKRLVSFIDNLSNVALFDEKYANKNDQANEAINIKTTIQDIVQIIKPELKRKILI